MIKAFASADGLSQLLVRHKVISSPIALWEFAKGFSQSSQLFDFVLVGTGKDRADKKIEGTMIRHMQFSTPEYLQADHNQECLSTSSLILHVIIFFSVPATTMAMFGYWRSTLLTMLFVNG